MNGMHQMKGKMMMPDEEMAEHQKGKMPKKPMPMKKKPMPMKKGKKG